MAVNYLPLSVFILQKMLIFNILRLVKKVVFQEKFNDLHVNAAYRIHKMKVMLVDDQN